ncbi:type I-F CRISPR-associated protein Csy2 [Serratia microhaemolytica]|uniref:type I-F CRISPR-associated protein Csy2 n=1 Tax=Serratia microhaemolytica TaxID=2675110 RepID=UPI0014774618|nr:type I-F CRISPR-associated protein Csy2 [Serratia microhaemolytica]
MKSTLLLRHLKVENANAISGMTYGFPAISHFLGFTHALSRRLQQAYGVTLGGCAVIAHRVELQSHALGSRGEQIFALSRNPLTKEGKTAPFNEEGRVHLDLSLLIECQFDLDDLAIAPTLEQRVTELQRWFAQTIPTLRLAGGSILSLAQVTWREDTSEQGLRQLRRSLLPGFALVSRHDLLTAHHQQRLQQQPQAQLLDTLLTFVTLQQQAEQAADGTVAWQYQPKPATGYLVPIAVGYQAISDCYPAGSVTGSRDRHSPFSFVESIYTLGQWVSPHRVSDLNTLLWRYRYQQPIYLCENHYASPSLAIEDDEEEFIS